MAAINVAGYVISVVTGLAIDLLIRRDPAKEESIFAIATYDGRRVSCTAGNVAQDLDVIVFGTALDQYRRSDNRARDVDEASRKFIQNARNSDFEGIITFDPRILREIEIIGDLDRKLRRLR